MRSVHTIQLPVYAILRAAEPTGKSSSSVRINTEGRINNEAAFADFLRDPVKSV